MTPGRYLRMRREAAGMAIDCLVLSPDTIAAIESDVRAPTDMELTALGWAFPFDESVLAALTRGVVPSLCRICACGELDACLTSRGYCRWVEGDLCSACAPESDENRFVTCECGADVDTDIFSECHACGSVVE